MNKLFLAVSVLSAGVALGQTTTQTKSTTTSSSNYNNTNTNNYNSQNATMGTGSSTNRPTSTTGTPSNSGMSTGTSGTGSYNSGSGTSTTGTGMGTSGNSTGTGSYNSNSGTGSMTTTPSTGGSTNNMSTGSATTPSTSGSYNNNGVNGVNTGTSNSTYSTQTTTTRPERTKDYKNFAYGIYVGVNTTRFKGEALDANGAAEGLTGRLGYQAGFFVRGGGRLFGQIGAEYFASSSNYFTAGQGTTPTNIRDQINIKYIQVPVYIGYKLTESDRGISSVRVQVGVEYANQIGSTANKFGNLNDFQLKSGTFNGLGQLGLDAGPVFLDLTYHYGFSEAIQRNTGFAGSQRRILSASLGFKF